MEEQSKGVKGVKEVKEVKGVKGVKGVKTIPKSLTLILSDRLKQMSLTSKWLQATFTSLTSLTPKTLRKYPPQEPSSNQKGERGPQVYNRTLPDLGRVLFYLRLNGLKRRVCLLSPLHCSVP